MYSCGYLMYHEFNYRYLLSRIESDNGVSVVQSQRPGIGSHTFHGQDTFSMKAVSPLGYSTAG